MKLNLVILTSITACLLATTSPVVLAEDWEAPPALADKVNPVENTADARKEGGSIYAADCAMCHGTSGKGDGASGIYLNPKPGDFTNIALWNKSDGSLFWIISNGFNTMTAFKGFTTVDQRWKLVLYIRSLTPPKPAVSGK